MNALLEISFRVPFDQIQAAQVEPAIDELLADAARRLDETIASPEPLHALDTMTERLEYAMNVVRHLESVATTPDLRAVFNAVQFRLQRTDPDTVVWGDMVTTGCQLLTDGAWFPLADGDHLLVKQSFYGVSWSGFTDATE